MKRAKKLLIIGIIAVVTLGGILGGVAIANADEPTTTANNPVSANLSNLLDKIATHYKDITGQDLNTDALTQAFKDAQQDIRSEALDNYLNKLIDQGKIDESQAQAYKDWLANRPDVNIPGLNPPVGPGPFGGRPFAKIGRAFGGMFRGWCGPNGAPSAPTTTQP